MAYQVGQRDAARLCPSLQPQEVYSAAVVCGAGAQRVSSVRLPQALAVLPRCSRISCGDQTARSSAFHHLPEGRGTFVGVSACPASAARDHPHRGETSPYSSPRSPGRLGRHGLGIASCQYLLCAPPRCWRKNMAKNLLHPFPQGGRSLRLSESLDPRAGSRPRPAARHASLSRGLGSSSGHNSDQCDGGRRRIRQRRVARLRSSTARGAHAHSPVGRSPDGKASLGLLAAKNGGVFES